MLSKIKIENFRSIKDSVEFSMQASTGNHLSDHMISVSDDISGLLRTACFYGPNASGKSNLLKAFKALIDIVVNSASYKEESEIASYDPYALSVHTRNAPTKFEIEFYVKNLRYIYIIQYDRNVIVHESLDCVYSKVPSNIFVRDQFGWDKIKFGNAFKGGNKKIPFFNNQAYLSKIGGIISAPEFIRDVYKFFARTLSYLNVNVKFNTATLFNMEKRRIFAKQTGEFLSLVDTGINAIIIEEQDVPHMPFLGGFSDYINNLIFADSKDKFMFSHLSEEGESILLEKEEESDGTKRLFELTPALLVSFMSQRVFIIDEFDHNIHPHLAALILKLFNDSEVNQFGSQLIFSTHNFELMKPTRMRRDQIWFSEKINGSTSIFSLDDFEKDKVKASSPFHKWYDEGRFGGTPNLDFIKVKKYFLGLSQKLQQKN